MRTRLFLAASLAWLGATIGSPILLQGQAQPAAARTPAKTLRPVSAFASIRDAEARAVALFKEAGKVLQHPRCLNCHPSGERPLQTDAMRPHEPLVVRGEDGHGAPVMGCNTCHHRDNYNPAHVPGHPQWHLAPLEMAWVGKSLSQICEQLKDPARNGGKSLAAVVQHSAEDSLVGWGWSPGVGRTAAPGTQQRFGELMRAWADAGAHCPASP